MNAGIVDQLRWSYGGWDINPSVPKRFPGAKAAFTRLAEAFEAPPKKSDPVQARIESIVAKLMPTGVEIFVILKTSRDLRPRRARVGPSNACELIIAASELKGVRNDLKKVKVYNGAMSRRELESLGILYSPALSDFAFAQMALKTSSIAKSRSLGKRFDQLQLGMQAGVWLEHCTGSESKCSPRSEARKLLQQIGPLTGLLSPGAPLLVVARSKTSLTAHQFDRFIKAGSIATPQGRCTLTMGKNGVQVEAHASRNNTWKRCASSRPLTRTGIASAWCTNGVSCVALYTPNKTKGSCNHVYYRTPGGKGWISGNKCKGKLQCGMRDACRAWSAFATPTMLGEARRTISVPGSGKLGLCRCSTLGLQLPL